MKPVFKDLYSKAFLYAVLILAVWSLLPLRTQVLENIERMGLTLEKPREDSSDIVKILYRLGLGLAIFIQSNCKVETLKDYLFIKKYQVPMTLAFLPLMGSGFHFIINGLLTIYREDGLFFMTLDFLWIPILAILYFVHKYLERAYEDFDPEEN